MGSAMNAQLYKSLQNPWLALLVSFAPDPVAGVVAGGPEAKCPQGHAH